MASTKQGQAVRYQGKEYRVQGGMLLLDNLGISDLADVKGLADLTSVDFINLNNNKLQDLSGIGFISNLDTIHLINNNLDSLKGIDNFPDLKRLVIDENRLIGIDELGKMSSLEQVSINNNNIKSLEILRKCPHLQELEASGNRLTDAAGIEKMDSLNLLKINDNQLTSLRNIPLEKLFELEARGNNIISLRFNSGIYTGEEYPIYDFANNLIEMITIDDQFGFGGLILRKNYLRDLDWLEKVLFWRGARFDITKNPVQLEKKKTDQLWEAGVELVL